MSASTSEPAGSSSAFGRVPDSNSFIGFCRWRGAKRTSKVSGWARRRVSRAAHCAKGRAENLRSRTLGQQLDLKAIEHRISGFSQTKFLGPHLRHPRAQRLRSHSRLFDFSVHLAQQRRPRGFQGMVGNAGKGRIVVGFLTSVNVPVSVGSGMRLGPGGDRVQQRLQPIFRIDPAEISAMSAQFAKERLVVGSRALPDDRDCKPGRPPRDSTGTATCRRLA